MNNIKFYIGPMTQNVIDSVIEVANEKKIKFGFCVSRRQIDYDYGYVEDGIHKYDTSHFIQYVRSKTSNVIIERDHSGINQGKKIGPALYDMHSMLYDAFYNIDIIHIDPWKKFPSYFSGLRETINNIILINQRNPNVLFEVGTEEAIFSYKHIDLHVLLKDLKYELGDIFKNIRYAVIQSGTGLMGTKNIGTFDLKRLQDMIAICKEFEILSKEHNGDYLFDQEIKIRFDNGLDAINIAPEFGVLETKVLLDHIKNNIDFDKIYDICLNGGKWKKWVPKEFHVERDKTHLIEICGHYHNKQIKDIVNIDDEIIKAKLKEKLYSYTEL